MKLICYPFPVDAALESQEAVGGLDGDQLSQIRWACSAQNRDIFQTEKSFDRIVINRST